ncbi:MAG TPA: PilZ domain-containing protein [Bryobacteraceae bacterium]|nr:PilZ domain-containing protein [Bryobacteraceae bacterium]
MLEQRNSRRFDLKLPFELLRPGLQVVRNGETKNVSSSGVLFSADVPVQPGQRIEYAITLPCGEKNVTLRIRCIGKIVRRISDVEAAATLERYDFIREKIS